jgi:hypothetical protein
VVDPVEGVGQLEYLKHIKVWVVVGLGEQCVVVKCTHEDGIAVPYWQCTGFELGAGGEESKGFVAGVVF